MCLNRFVFLLSVLLVPGFAFAGGPVFLDGDLGRVPIASKADLHVAADATLQNILMSRLGALGDEEMHVVRSFQDVLGNTHVRFHQTYNGLPVIGADMYLHTRTDGAVYAVNGSFLRGGDLPFSPALGAEKALALGLGKAGLAGERIDSGAELVYVLDEEGEAHLAWLAVVAYVDHRGPQRDHVFVDAMNGTLVARHPQNHYALSISTYDCNGGTGGCTLVSTSPFPINTGDPGVDGAHNNTIATYNYYFNEHGRDSLDDNGMPFIVWANYGNNYSNVFFDGSRLICGSGDGVNFLDLCIDADIVAHELTHGVIVNESNLIYANESGALNESLADIFGAAVDRQEGASITDTWLVGEDVLTPGVPGDGVRVMNYPSSVGDYDYYPTRYTGTADNGGVHWNSGIGNLAFVLMVEGGTHPDGATTINVPALDPDFDTSLGMAADIFYYANTTCLTASSNFEAARGCTALAAQLIYGASAETSVQAGWDAVGVPGGTGGGGGGGGGGGAPCTGTSVYTGTVPSGGTLVTPNCTTLGNLSGKLQCLSGIADLDLYLDKETCSGWMGCSFSAVASSATASCSEGIKSYSGTRGTYRWRVVNSSGPDEDMRLCTDPC